jgi:hypothetical protein
MESYYVTIHSDKRVSTSSRPSSVSPSYSAKHLVKYIHKINEQEQFCELVTVTHRGHCPVALFCQQCSGLSSAVCGWQVVRRMSVLLKIAALTWSWMITHRTVTSQMVDDNDADLYLTSVRILQVTVQESGLKANVYRRQYCLTLLALVISSSSSRVLHPLRTFLATSSPPRTVLVLLIKVPGCHSFLDVIRPDFSWSSSSPSSLWGPFPNLLWPPLFWHQNF